MSLFGTTFRKQVTDFLPPVIRGESTIDWLYSLVEPVESALNAEAVYIDALDDLLRYKGQKIVLQSALNTLLAVVGIVVVCRRTFNGIAPVLYNETESSAEETAITANPPYTSMVTINESEESNDAGFDVQIPVGIWTQALEDEVEYYVKLLKASGTTYTITVV